MTKPFGRAHTPVTYRIIHCYIHRKIDPYLDYTIIRSTSSDIDRSERRLWGTCMLATLLLSTERGLAVLLVLSLYCSRLRRGFCGAAAYSRLRRGWLACFAIITDGLCCCSRLMRGEGGALERLGARCSLGRCIRNCRFSCGHSVLKDGWRLGGGGFRGGGGVRLRQHGRLVDVSVRLHREVPRAAHPLIALATSSARFASASASLECRRFSIM